MITLSIRTGDRATSDRARIVWGLTFDYNKEAETYTVINQQIANLGMYGLDFVGWDLKKLAAWLWPNSNGPHPEEFHKVSGVSGRWCGSRWCGSRWCGPCTVPELHKILDEQRKAEGTA